MRSSTTRDPAAAPRTATVDVTAVGTFRPPPATPRRACAVCGGPVPPAAAVRPGDGPPAAAVCGALCAHRLASRPAWQRCAACGRPTARDEWAAGACADPACREELFARRPARARAAARAAVAVDAAAARDAAVAALAARGAGAPAPTDVPVVAVPGTDAEAFPLLVAPRDARPAVRLPRRRRRALARHVRAVASLALAGGAPADDATAPPPPDPATTALLGGACATCAGRCCRAGGDQAYLSAATLARHLAAHPAAQPAAAVRAAVAAYVARVPAATVPGSCVFHGADGCGLPREMRSDTCNRYLCDGLVELRAELGRRAAAGAPARAAYVAVVEDGRVTRGALTPD